MGLGWLVGWFALSPVDWRAFTVVWWCKWSVLPGSRMDNDDNNDNANDNDNDNDNGNDNNNTPHHHQQQQC